MHDAAVFAAPASAKVIPRPPAFGNNGGVKKPRKWLRRLGIFFGLTLALLGWRSCSLPAAANHTRAAADLSKLPKLRVCWVEYAHKNEWGWLGSPGFSRTWTWKSTASGILIRHPQGDVLLDGGNSPNFDAELAALKFFPRNYLKMAAGGLRTTTKPTDALTKLGVEPAKLKWFIPSHAHLDHLGGVMDLPKDVPVMMSPDEMYMVRARKDEGGLSVVPAQAHAVVGRTAELPFADKPYETWDQSADLFGDGSVVFVKLPGHTPGSVGAFINLGPGRRLLHVGDVVDISEQITRRVGKSFVLMPTDGDRDKANESVAKVSQFHEVAPDVVIVPAHDRTAYEKFFGPEPGCVEK
jgi:glyoxylase-like metal-dependent hydrolase (beta-lactamase superfamily II)